MSNAFALSSIYKNIHSFIYLSILIIHSLKSAESKYFCHVMLIRLTNLAGKWLILNGTMLRCAYSAANYVNKEKSNDIRQILFVYILVIANWDDMRLVYVNSLNIIENIIHWYSLVIPFTLRHISSSRRNIFISIYLLDSYFDRFFIWNLYWNLYKSNNIEINTCDTSIEVHKKTFIQ